MPFSKSPYHCNGFWAFNMGHKISVKLGHSWFFLAVQAKTFIWTSCLSLNQFMYFIISYQYYHKISFSCSKNQILSMVDASHSAHYNVSATGVHASTMSRLYSRRLSELKKSTSGCQTKIFPLIPALPSISSQFTRQKMQSRWPKPLATLSTNPSPQIQSAFDSK